MKIKKIEIGNFRNYYGVHSFNLDKKVTILFGENGYGKSSFFDAIEWCITNEIDRFKAQLDGEEKFTNYDCVNNLARQEEEPNCYVSIYYDNYRLHRKYNVSKNHTGVFLYKYEDQSEVIVAQGQKNVENELYKYKESIKSGGARLIKHSYVLSQDQITNFIRSNPRERFDALASIMGINKVTDFIDNLKISSSYIQDIYNNTESDFNSNRKLIADRINDREEYNQLKNEIDISMESLLTIKKLSYPNNMGLDSGLIDQKIKDISDKLAEKRQNVVKLRDIPSDYNNHSDLKIKQLNMDKEYEVKINLLTRVDNSKDLTIREIDELKTSFIRIREEKSLSKTIESKENEIKSIYRELEEKKYGNLTTDVAQQKLVDLRKKNEIIEFTLLYLEDYQKAKLENVDLPILIDKYDKEVRILESKIKSRKKLLISLGKWLEKNNASSSLQGLVKYLKGISDYVGNNDVEGICPVCSTPIGASLENKIQHNIIHHTAKVSKMEFLVVKAFELQERREKELSLLQQDFRNYEQKITNLKRQLEIATDILRNTPLNVQFDYKLFSSDKINVINSREEIKQEIKELEDLREKKSKLLSLESNYKTLLEGLNIKDGNESLENKLGLKEKTLKRKLARLNKLIEDIKRRIEVIKKERNTILLYITKVDSVESILIGNREFSTVVNELEKEINILEKDFQLIVHIKELFIKKNEKSASINSLIGYEEKDGKLIKEMKKWNDNLGELDGYIKNLNMDVGEHALEFLNHPHSKIQQYYRYLNPIPTSNGNIEFITENTDGTKRGLTITIPNRKDNGEHELLNARYTLSSAQLNTLAIAIFLVVNESQDVGIFDFVAIDDPIQNMDDVNQYTMCDILGGIRKQLLFSTHDLEFLKLFIKKNEYKKEDIRVYILETPNLKTGRVKEVNF